MVEKSLKEVQRKQDMFRRMRENGNQILQLTPCKHDRSCTEIHYRDPEGRLRNRITDFLHF